MEMTYPEAEETAELAAWEVEAAGDEEALCWL
jgi:hypothetical protein